MTTLKNKYLLLSSILLLAISGCGSNKSPEPDTVNSGPAVKESPVEAETTKTSSEAVSEEITADAKTPKTDASEITEDSETNEDIVITSKERIGSRFNPLSEGDNIELRTVAWVGDETVYVLDLKLLGHDSESGTVTFNITVKDILNGSTPLHLYTDDIYSNYLQGFSAESAPSLDINGDFSVLPSEECVIGYGESKDVTYIMAEPSHKYVGFRTHLDQYYYDTYCDGVAPTDQDVINPKNENHDNLYEYFTVFGLE